MGRIALKSSIYVGTIASVEIIITIGTAIRIKNKKNICSYFRAIFLVNCYYNLNPSENDSIFSNSQPRLGTKKINGGLKLSEIKV